MQEDELNEVLQARLQVEVECTETMMEALLQATEGLELVFIEQFMIKLLFFLFAFNFT